VEEGGWRVMKTLTLAEIQQSSNCGHACLFICNFHHVDEMHYVTLTLVGIKQRPLLTAHWKTRQPNVTCIQLFNKRPRHYLQQGSHSKLT